MVENIQFILNGLSGIQKQLESFLENDIGTTHFVDKFELSTDLRSIKGLSLGLPEEYIKKIIVVFSRISLFYQAGVLVENQDGRWKAQAFFNESIVEVLKDSQNEISLPQVNLLIPFKARSCDILKKLHLQHLDSDNRLTCLLIKVTADFSFLLFSPMPDLWLRDHTRVICHELQNCFSD